MTAARTVVVLGGSSSTHARIPAQMLRDASYRVILANTESTVAAGTERFFDEIHSVITATERLILVGRSAVIRGPHTVPSLEKLQILTPTRRRSVYGRLLLGWLRGRALTRLVRRLHPGLVHVQGMDVGGMATYYYLRAMGGTRSARRPGTMAHLFSYKPRFAAVRQREMRALAACDIVHTSSPVVARIYREHYDVPAEKLHVLVRGIDLETFAPRDEATLAAARAEWGVPADKFVIIHNRHLHRMYHVDVAVTAFIELARRSHDVFLILVRGSMRDAAYEEQLLAQLSAHGLRDRVALMPPILNPTQMGTALQLSDCSINTVPSDAFPVSILESMYCRAVPVVRDLESYDMFVRDGETGFRCSGTGAEQYVEKIERLIRDRQLKQRMAEAAAARVAAEGSVELYRRKLLTLVEQAWRTW